MENLTEEELRSACRTRGMRVPFGEGAPAFMQRQLREWLDLSLHRSGPCTLALLLAAADQEKTILLQLSVQSGPCLGSACTCIAVAVPACCWIAAMRTRLKAGLHKPGTSG